MAGTYRARSARGRYSQAGYTGEAAANDELYIARVPAGSAQDELIDFNRTAYRSERPWDEAPVPVFSTGEAVADAPVVRRKRVKQKTFLDRLAAQAARERKDVMMCFALVAVIVMMTAAWGQKIVQGVQIQHSINNYQAGTVALERENERLSQQLEIARSGERIRNLAQNELGMLRPERALTQTIYIQAPEAAVNTTLQNQDEPRMEALDILLGLLNVLHIGE